VDGSSIAGLLRGGSISGCSGSSFLGDLLGEVWLECSTICGEAWAKVDGMGGTGMCWILLESDSSTRRIALGVAGRPMCGPFRFAYMLLPALGSTLALRLGRSLSLIGTKTVLGNSARVGMPLVGAGESSSG